MRALLIPVLLGSLALAGCANSGGTTAPPQVSETIAQVQNAVREGCAFVPTAATISAILSAIGVPYVGMVTDVASQVCMAIIRPSAGRGSRPALKVNGKVITIEGKRV